MLSKPHFVLFLSLLYLVRCSISSGKRLKWVFPGTKYIMRCAEEQYFVVTDWWELDSTNISCLTEVDPFDDASEPHLITESVYVNCDSLLRHFYVTYRLIYPLSPLKALTTIGPVTGTIEANNEQYSFTSRGDHNTGARIIEQRKHPWSGKPVVVSNIKFDGSSLICQNRMNFSGMVHEGECTGENGNTKFFCYYDLLSDNVPTDIHWEFLEELIDSESRFGDNRRTKGGYPIDMSTLQAATTTVRWSNSSV